MTEPLTTDDLAQLVTAQVMREITKILDRQTKLISDFA